MIRFFKQLQLELAFIFRNWLFIVAPFIYFIVVYLWLNNYGYNQGQQYYFQHTSEFLSIGHTLSIGIIMLASVLAIRREKQTVMLDWTNSLPTSSTSFILAKFFAINIYSFLFTTIFVLSFLGIGLMDGQAFSFLLSHGFNFAIQSQCSYIVSTALGMFLTVSIPNRIVYIIAFCAWMFGTFFIEGFIIQRYQLFYLKTFHLNQFFLDAPHSEGWAYSLQQQEAWLSRLFVVFFSLLLLCLMILQTTTSRLSSHTKKAWISVFMVVVLTVASVIPYSSLWVKRLAHFETLNDSADLHFSDDLTKYENETVTDVNKYQIEIERIGNSTISVQSTLELPSFDLDELTFILYPAFQIESITWNGKLVHFQREHHKVKVPNLEKKALNELQVSYTGSLNEWGSVYNSEHNFAFIHKDNMFLPSYIAWYPIIGEFPIFDFHYNFAWRSYLQQISFISGIIPKADFSITTKGFEQEIFGTNDRTKQLQDGTQVLESVDTTGVTLFSLPDLVEVKDELDISIISRKPFVEDIQAQMAILQDVFYYLETWIPLTNDFTKKLIVLPSLQFTGLDTYRITSIDSSIVVDERLSRLIISNNNYIDNKFIEIQAEIIKEAIMGSDLNTYYHYNNSVLYSIAQAFLLITFIEFFEYDWEDFTNFHGTNYWGLITLGYQECSDSNTTKVENIDCFLDRAELPLDEQILYMIAKEIAQGNMDEMKMLLKAVLDDIQTNKKTTYSYWEWLTMWNSFIENQEVWKDKQKEGGQL